MIHFNQYNISQISFQHAKSTTEVGFFSGSHQNKTCVFYNHSNFILNFEFHVPDGTYVASTPLYTVRSQLYSHINLPLVSVVLKLSHSYLTLPLCPVVFTCFLGHSVFC